VKRTELKRTSGLKRAPMRRRKPRKRDGDYSPAAWAQWKQTMGKACCHPECERATLRLQQHHVVYVQHLPKDTETYDVRNGVTVCVRCHNSHHRRGSKVIPLVVLPDAAIAFAREIFGPGKASAYLRKRYAGDDPRLDRLDAEWRLAETAPAI
jgi:hypothetical protein